MILRPRGLLDLALLSAIATIVVIHRSSRDAVHVVIVSASIQPVLRGISRLPKLQKNHIAGARTTDEASEMLQDFDSAGIRNDVSCGKHRGERDLFGVLRRLHSRLI